MLSVEKNLEFKKNLFPFIKDVKSATAFISNDLGIDSLICVPIKREKNSIFLFSACQMKTVLVYLIFYIAFTFLA